LIQLPNSYQWNIRIKQAKEKHQKHHKENPNKRVKDYPQKVGIPKVVMNPQMMMMMGTTHEIETRIIDQ
jgi:hypothetical protein